MNTFTLVGIQAILNDSDTIFMRQGRGSVVHLSAGSCRQNNLLCGVTYSRSGNRASHLMALTGYTEMPVESMCKNCIKIVQDAVQPMAVAQ